jgi:hypothetical protein
MSRRQIIEHTWYRDCELCGRRITARTHIVLRQLAEEHFAVCSAEAVARRKERKAALAQLDLFGNPVDPKT